jgi:acyl-CoA thioesterase
MNQLIKNAIIRAVAAEPFVQTLGMELTALEQGFSAVEMTYDPLRMDNLFGRAHGGAIFALIDEAFETVGQTDGTVAVAMNVNVSYVSSPDVGTRLRAEAREVHQTKRTANYDIRVTDGEGRLIATCQALAYRTGKPLPFLDRPPGPV